MRFTACCVTLSLVAILTSPVSAEDKHEKEQLYAWKLGTKLSLVAWAYYHGAAPDVYQQELDACKLIATKGLSTSVPDFPAKKSDANAPDVQALNYITKDGAKPIARDLLNKFGAEVAAVFELAMKARLAVYLYAEGKKDDDGNLALQDGLASAGKRSALPEKLWQPVIKAVKDDRPHTELKKAVSELDEQVTAHLQAALKK